MTTTLRTFFPSDPFYTDLMLACQHIDEQQGCSETGNGILDCPLTSHCGSIILNAAIAMRASMNVTSPEGRDHPQFENNLRARIATCYAEQFAVWYYG